MKADSYVMSNPAPLHQEALIQWSPAPEGFITINTDGSVIQPSKHAAGGGIIRDWQGRKITAFAVNLGICSIMRRSSRLPILVLKLHGRWVIEEFTSNWTRRLPSTQSATTLSRTLAIAKRSGAFTDGSIEIGRFMFLMFFERRIRSLICLPILGIALILVFLVIACTPLTSIGRSGTTSSGPRPLV
ncbi:hypothetical protein LINPERHAP1_LOCUS27249 [Linum perenne]